MAEGFVQVAPDSTGAKMRTRERTIGANAIEEQIVIVEQLRLASGVYIASPALQTCVLAAHATTTGFLCLFNRSAAQMVEVRRVEFLTFPSVVTAHTLAPEITLERCTFTGTPTGTLTTPAKSVAATQNGETLDAANVAELRVPGGATITAGAAFHRFIVPPVLAAFSTTSEVMPPVTSQMYRPTDDDGRVVLANGEGMLIRQGNAGGATAETRKFALNLSWREYTIP